MWNKMQAFQECTKQLWVKDQENFLNNYQNITSLQKVPFYGGGRAKIFKWRNPMGHEFVKRTDDVCLSDVMVLVSNQFSDYIYGWLYAKIFYWLFFLTLNWLNV